MKKKRIQVNTTVAFTDDIPFFGLVRDDIAEVIDIQRDENGYAEMMVKVVNAHGETISVFPVQESQVRELRKDEILHVRTYLTAALAEPARSYRSRSDSAVRTGRRKGHR